MPIRTIRPSIECAVGGYAMAQSPKERGAIYSREIRKLMSDDPAGLETVIRAANTLGTSVGTLIVQRCLDLLKIEFPLLERISTRFDDNGRPARYGEVLKTRLITIPTVETYSTSTGYPVSAATATDVAVTINLHKCIQVAFNANELAGTRRLLFGEQEPAMHYALGKDLMDALYALITVGNFPNATTCALVDFRRSAVIAVGAAMADPDRNANTGRRSLLISPDYYGQLAEDITIVGNANNPAGGTAIGTGILPMVHGFLPIEAPNLPSADNLVGFGCRADALALAACVPGDYTQIPGFGPIPSDGVVDYVSSPDTGLTVMVVHFVNHLLGLSYMRLAWMYGVAVWNPVCGQRLVSAQS